MILYNPTVSGSLLVTGSLTTTGTITSQTLVVQTVTSSIEFVTGSTRNGTLSTNTHEFTGSVYMSGSLGIGTSSPIGKFNIIDGTNKSLIIQDSGIADTIEVAAYSVAGGTRNLMINAANLLFGTGASGGGSAAERMRIDPSGSVMVKEGGKLGFRYSSGDLGPYQYMYANGATELQFVNNYTSNTSSKAFSFVGSGGSERLTILNGGNVGIGKTNPGVALDVTGYIRSDSRFYINDGTNTVEFGPNYIQAYLTSGAANTNLLFYTGTTERVRITTGGSLLVGTTDSAGLEKMIHINSPNNCGYKLSVNGTTRGYLYADSSNVFYLESTNSARIRIWVNSANGVYMDAGATSFTSNSDERLKTDLNPITDAINKVLQLRSVTGRFKTDDESVRRSFLIAQDVQSVLPEAVTEDKETGMLGVQYTEVIPLLVASIKEQQAKITALEEILQRNNIQ
jgi:hypothetical protein